MKKSDFPEEFLSAIPAWAQWLAQDEDGTWWAYEAEPNQQHNGWYENEVGRIQRLGQALRGALLPYLKNEPSIERRHYVLGLINLLDVTSKRGNNHENDR